MRRRGSEKLKKQVTIVKEAVVEQKSPVLFEEPLIVEQNGDQIIVKISLKNTIDENIRSTSIEINFNQGRSTKFVDLIDMLRIETKGNRYITRYIDSNKLRKGFYEVSAKLYYKGKLVEDRRKNFLSI